MVVLPSRTALVRTHFGDDSAWESLLLEVRTPSEEGFLAHVTPVGDRAFEGLSVETLQEKQEGVSGVAFLADRTTLTAAEHPILAVPIPLGCDRNDRQPFRVVPAELWSVENNIDLANMDWEDFARSVDADGVFRGF